MLESPGPWVFPTLEEAVALGTQWAATTPCKSSSLSTAANLACLRNLTIQQLLANVQMNQQFIPCIDKVQLGATPALLFAKGILHTHVFLITYIDENVCSSYWSITIYNHKVKWIIMCLYWLAATSKKETYSYISQRRWHTTPPLSTWLRPSIIHLLLKRCQLGSKTQCCHGTTAWYQRLDIGIRSVSLRYRHYIYNYITQHMMYVVNIQLGRPLDQLWYYPCCWWFAWNRQ